MPQAARVTDLTGHGNPLTPGPGSTTTMIGFMPAWRALPSAVGGAVASLSNTMDQFMKKPVMTPADAAASLAQITSGMAQTAGQAAANGAPGAVGAASGGAATMMSTNVALTSAWTTASAVPGGQPAANQAYTEGIKAAAATAATGLMSALAGMADMHVCPLPAPIPPHGPGFVTQGSSTVMIDNLPAARQGDKVMEACGGADPISMGCPTVEIGDSGGSGGGGGGSGGGAAAQSEDEQLHSEVVAKSKGGPKKVSQVPDTCVGPITPAEQPESSPEPTWLAVRVRDFNDTPIANQNVNVTLENGQTVSGQTDQDGYIRFESLQAGPGEMTLPDVPEHEEDVEAAEQEEAGPESPQRAARGGRRPAEPAPDYEDMSRLPGPAPPRNAPPSGGFDDDEEDDA